MAIHANITKPSRRHGPHAFQRPKRSKRTRFVPALPDDVLSSLMGALAPAEVKALHFIAENGDLIVVADRTWLLTPAPKSLIDILASVGAHLDDLEHEPDEIQCEDEGSIDSDNDSDAAESFGTMMRGADYGYQPPQRIVVSRHCRIQVATDGTAIDPDGRRVRLALVGGAS